jgi:hypothetical protein
MIPIVAIIPIGGAAGGLSMSGLLAAPFMLLAIPFSLWLLVSLEGARPFTGKPDVWISWWILLAWEAYWLLRFATEAPVAAIAVFVVALLTLNMLRPVADDATVAAVEAARITQVPVSSATLSRVALVAGRLRLGEPVGTSEVLWALDVLDRLRACGELDPETDGWYRERLRAAIDSAPPT